MKLKALFSLLFVLAVGFTSLSHAAKTVNYGGSNHVVYSLGTIDTTSSNPLEWYIPAQRFRHTISLLQLDPTAVYNQLQAIRNSGQNTVSILLYNKYLQPEATCCNDGVLDGVWGEAIDNSTGALRVQHEANLRQYLAWVRQLGFKRIVVRFGYNGDPGAWASWDEPRYQLVWNFIWSVHNIVTSELSSWRNIKAIYDLGAENGGISGGQSFAFMQRLWADYTTAFGNSDTVGFSYAWTPGRHAAQLPLYGATRPKMWAFDLYNDLATQLQEIYTELGPLNNQPVLILETFHNDATAATGIQTALNNLPYLHVDTVNQWSILRSGAGVDHHFSHGAVSAQSSTSQFTSYAGLVGPRVVNITSTDSARLAMQDINCGSTTTTCSARMDWGTPTSGVAQIWVSQNGASPTLVVCYGLSGNVTIPWLVSGSEYQFRLYYTPSCGSAPGTLLNTSTITLQ